MLLLAGPIFGVRAAKAQNSLSVMVRTQTQTLGP
jgi:hypothetical protein